MWVGITQQQYQSFLAEVAALRYDCTIREDNPYAYYKLDEQSGTTAVDSSGNLRHGTYLETVRPVDGIVLGSSSGGTFVDNAASSGINPPFSAQGWEAITVEGWYQSDGSASGRPQSVVNDSSDAVAFSGVALSLTDTAIVFQLNAANNDTDRITVNVAVDNTDGEVHHVAATWDKNGDKKLRVFRDGTQIGVSAAWDFTPHTTNSLRVGARNIVTLPDVFEDTLDNVAIYNTALSAERILAHYNAGAVWAADEREVTGYDDLVDTAAPYAYYKLDETSGTQAVDSSGNARHGTYLETVQPVDPVTFGSVKGQSFINGGLTGGIDLGFGAGALLGKYTVAAWFSHDTVEAHDMYLIDGGRANDYFSPLNVNIQATGGIAVYMAMQDGTSNEFYMTAPAGTVAFDGRTHFVAVTFDKDTDVVAIYVDGAVVAQGTWTFEPYSPPVNLHIGHNQSISGQPVTDSATRPFKGRLDAVAIYDRALTAEEIESHYCAGAPWPVLPPAAHDTYLATLSPLAHWKMSAVAGETTETDVSGNGYDGTYIDTVVEGAGIHSGSSSSQYWPGEGAGSGFSTTINPHTWTGFTFTTWYEPEINSWGKDHFMFQGYSSFKLFFNVDWTEVTAYAATDQGDIFLNLYTWQAPNLPADLFDAPHFYALRYNGTTGAFSFWIDGVKFAEYIGATNDFIWSNGPLVIHTNNGNSDNKGKADTTAIWNSALSDAQILQLYNEGI